MQPCLQQVERHRFAPICYNMHTNQQGDESEYMSALPNEPMTMTEAEYLAFERASEVKHEYIGGKVHAVGEAHTMGKVHAMTGASRAHNLICSYTTAALINALGDKLCQVYPADMRVMVEATRLYTYPDISVVCGEAQIADETFDTLLNPALIIEVLSPSTENYDRGKKFRDYRKLPSLREYLLISQTEPRIERYLRGDGSEWVLTDVEGLDASIDLPSIGCALALADVYRKVAFDVDDG